MFTIPPSNVRNIGDVLLEKNISFAYFGDQFNAYLADPYGNYIDPGNTYCNICNFFQYSTSIMTNAKVRQSGAAGHDSTSTPTSDLHSGNAIAGGVVCQTRAAISMAIRHRRRSICFEGFVKKIVDHGQSKSDLWANTAIFITMDEGGGYYDSGYVQALDYFGDGTRIPMIVVSTYSTGGHISHTYTDHVSILKFIEANWSLPTVTKRSRDNLPNPTTGADPYKPTNGPAIGDLTDLFKFHKPIEASRAGLGNEAGSFV